METVTHTIGDLSADGRTAAETLVGHALASDQQIVIQVVAAPLAARQSGEEADDLPPWCDVYAGLTDEQIAELERAIARRLDLDSQARQPYGE